jgi:CubicO group peptidase (beta-lactamase class C family)
MVKFICNSGEKLINFSVILLSLFLGVASGLVQADEIDDFLLAKMAKKKIPGLQIAIIRDNQIIKSSSYGVANVQHGVAINQDTVFSIASMTKGFTGVAIMQLVEQDKLVLDASISTYLTDLPLSWQAITVRQLLNHTSGLPDIVMDELKLIDPRGGQQSWELVQQLVLEAKPNTQVKYNQTNYALLGKIIDKVSGQPFAEFIDQYQLQKVVMQKTSAAGFGYQGHVVPNLSGFYTYDSGGKMRNLSPSIPPFLAPAASMNSNANELARYTIALQRGDLFKHTSSLDSLWSVAVLNNGNKAMRGSQHGSALGWYVIDRPVHPAVYVAGGNSSALLIYPKDNLTIVVVSNLIGTNPKSFIDEIAGFYLPDMKAENGFGLPPAIKTAFIELKIKGYDQIIEIVTRLQQNKGLVFKPNDVNNWGYKLLEQNKSQQALEVFILNTFLHPKIANTYDSLAETHLAMGHIKQAIEFYQKALDVDPTYYNAQNAKELVESLKPPR